MENREKKVQGPGGPDWKHPVSPPIQDMTLPDQQWLSDSFLDIPYGSQSGSQKLDLFLPANGTAPYPVLTVFHGGGWSIGDKRAGITELAAPFLARGYAVASANYRLTGEAIFPSQIFDSKAVIRWLRANANEYKIDPDRIMASGDSAGAYLAVMLGASAGVKELEDLSIGNAGVSSQVNAVVEWYGPVDFALLDAHHIQLGQSGRHDNDDSPESKMLGNVISKVPETCRKANPLNYINSTVPPFYIQHGKADDAVPYLQSVLLAEALKKVIGIENVQLELIEGIGHMHPQHFSAENIVKILGFLTAHV
jgi:acetyl esterase/lipase